MERLLHIWVAAQVPRPLDWLVNRLEMHLFFSPSPLSRYQVLYIGLHTTVQRDTEVSSHVAISKSGIEREKRPHGQGLERGFQSF
jgi:hypothetical protein